MRHGRRAGSTTPACPSAPQQPDHSGDTAIVLQGKYKQTNIVIQDIKVKKVLFNVGLHNNEKQAPKSFSTDKT
jgi:hypothetical protein